MLKRFLAAYRHSAAWMIANPAEAVQLAVKRAIDGNDPALNREIIGLRNTASGARVTREHGLGAFDLTALQQGADVYYKLGRSEPLWQGIVVYIGLWDSPAP